MSDEKKRRPAVKAGDPPKGVDVKAKVKKAKAKPAAKPETDGAE